MSRLRIGVVGLGHMGKEHVRVVASLPEAELSAVADIDPTTRDTIARKYQVPAFADHQQLYGLIDAVIIAVPTSAHRDVARDFLRRGIPCLVEKPLASSLDQAEELVTLSQRFGVLLQVGHIERFNPALLDLERRNLHPRFIQGQRLSLFSGRCLDVGVVLDLMIHDLDVVLALVRQPVQEVEAVGVSLFGGHEDIAEAWLTFANGTVASLTASRISTKPSRRLIAYAPDGYVELDFFKKHTLIVQPSAKARELGWRPDQLDITWAGLMREKLFGQWLEVLEFEHNEGDQLTEEIRHFITCIRCGRRPRVSGEDGRDAIALAERILARMRCCHRPASSGLRAA
ncbi:MAG: Gfo/Idh/MocA family oxidoreductase [Gemmatales bacterium]|nr:Gfo/Idh/MocA family oxidoreductase [Gemmatales bacterium]MDW8175226.1 Gfo/Idh/MocA family oxidoreductase [Gemmatales bacterium]